jgi:hypothetical protein
MNDCGDSVFGGGVCGNGGGDADIEEEGGDIE